MEKIKLFTISRYCIKFSFSVCGTYHPNPPSQTIQKSCGYIRSKGDFTGNLINTKLDFERMIQKVSKATETMVGSPSYKHLCKSGKIQKGGGLEGLAASRLLKNLALL